MKPVVYLGLSGGVDSAVAAALLLKEGYDVRGIFLKIWSEGPVCPWVEDRRDAIAVAAKLGIPLQTVDFEKEYKDQVFSYMVNEYKAGRTPNPDILCNEIIKFGVFLDWAIKDGADYIATGHHVRRQPKEGKDKLIHLLQGVDENKDQSYFLARLNQKQLQKTLFPIGEYTKEEVRQMATEFGLDEVAAKRSTRGICFIGNVDLKNILADYMVEKPGDIIDVNGNKIGIHHGVSFYTIGQRKGLNIPATDSSVKPYFVIDKKPETNILTVSNDPEKLEVKTVFADELHWISGKKQDLPLDCQARIRNLQPLKEAKLSIDEKGRVKAEFNEPIKGVAPGQFIAFYVKNELLSSAVIS